MAKFSPIDMSAGAAVLCVCVWTYRKAVLQLRAARVSSRRAPLAPLPPPFLPPPPLLFPRQYFSKNLLQLNSWR